MKPNPDPNRRPLSYRLLQLGFRFLFAVLTDYEIVGKDNLPTEGALLVITNHLSIADPAFIMFAIRRRLSGFVAHKYRSNPFIRWLTRTVGSIWIRQSEADLDALREAMSHFKRGGAFGIAMEGTRSKTHGLIRGKPGAAYLADRAGVAILPIAIAGTDEMAERLKRARRPKLRLVIGKPFRLPKNGRAKGPTLDEYADLMMCHIAALLPEKYRGVYADHPSLPQAMAYQLGEGAS